MPLHHFLAELKRRRVVRVALVYCAAAFVLLQVADILVPALQLPAWSMTLIVVLLALGFVIALVLSWVVDLTPDGIEVTLPAGSQRDRPQPVQLSREVIIVPGTLLLVAVMLGAAIALRPERDPATVADARSEPVTVAVLPFENLSRDPGTEPFVLGVHDDLLTQLSQLGALRVISRTSVMEYRNSPKNVRVIAAELGAGAVLEGGVQRSGDRIRLNVQLIDARSDAHLWAQTYERVLTAENVFAIQADIARSIVRALQAELAPAEQLALDALPTAILPALEAFHSGRDAFRAGADRRTRVSPRMFEHAVSLDPSFADAWAGLASARSWLVREGVVRDTTPALEALERARGLAPGALATQLAEAYFHYYARADLQRAFDAFSAALATAPGNVEVLQGLALVERRLGRMPEAIAHLREAVRLDPLSPGTQLELAWTLSFAGDPAGALPLSERALRLDPDHGSANASHFALLIWELGDTAAARVFAQESVLADASPQGLQWRHQLALVRRDYSTALSAAAADTTVLGMFAYGAHFAFGLPQVMKAAWLAGDREAVTVWSTRALAVADSVQAARAGSADRWARGAELSILRALAHAFRGDTAQALAAAAAARQLGSVDDVINRTTVLDHLVIVDVVSGRHAEALEGIRYLLEGPSLLKPARLRLDPIYDPLRRQPGFRVLAEERT
jgi:TolB-like protein/Tfp pilus assembly protein PilF